MLPDNRNEAREKILGLCAEYYRKFMQEKPFSPEDGVRYAGRVFNEDEITYWRNEKINTISSILVKIDIDNKKIVLPDRKTIYLKELIDLKRVR